MRTSRPAMMCQTPSTALILCLALATTACFSKPSFEAVQKGKVELDAAERKTIESLLSSAGLEAGDFRLFKDTSDWVTNDRSGVLVEGGHAVRLRIENTGLQEATDLSALSQLTHLEMDHNKISSLGNLPDTLLELSAGNNELDQIHALDDLAGLEVLYLQDNAITKIAGLDELVALKQLDLGGNEIQTMEGLSSLRAMWSLRLPGNKISRIGGLDGLAALTHIDLSDNQIASIEPLVAMKNLTSISVGSNKLEGVLDVSGFESIERLDVRNNALTAIEGPDTLGMLEFLDASGNAIEKKPEGTENIATLYLSGNPCEATPGKDTLPRNCSGSATMTVTKCVMGKCSGKIGKLTGCYRIESSGVDHDVRATISVQSGQVKVYLEQGDGSAMSVTASGGSPVSIEGRTTDGEVTIEALNGTARDVTYKLDPLQ